MIKLDQLIKLVKEEATKLRIHAIQQEKNNLDFSNLCSRDVNSCIYGQMTGNCFSDRATELLILCAKPFTSHQNFFNPVNKRKFSSKIRNTDESKCDFILYSPIEFFIAQYENQSINNELLIDFIKGKTETLNFIHEDE